MSFSTHIGRYEKKLNVYSSYKDGTFDDKDKKRLKPLTRLRDSEKELELANSGDIKLRVKDWYKDIDRDLYK